jgi:hypothetical protein
MQRLIAPSFVSALCCSQISAWAFQFIQIAHPTAILFLNSAFISSAYFRAPRVSNVHQLHSERIICIFSSDGWPCHPASTLRLTGRSPSSLLPAKRRFRCCSGPIVLRGPKELGRLDPYAVCESEKSLPSRSRPDSTLGQFGRGFTEC